MGSSFADSPTRHILKLAGITALALFGLREYDKWSTANAYCHHHTRINSAVQFTLSGPKGSERHIATFRGAAILSGTELLARPIPDISTSGHIPKLIHQTWSSQTLPRRLQHWSSTWRLHHVSSVRGLRFAPELTLPLPSLSRAMLRP